MSKRESIFLYFNVHRTITYIHISLYEGDLKIFVIYERNYKSVLHGQIYSWYNPLVQTHIYLYDLFLRTTCIFHFCQFTLIQFDPRNITQYTCTQIPAFVIAPYQWYIHVFDEYALNKKQKAVKCLLCPGSNIQLQIIRVK